MSEVFVSYDRESRALAEAVVKDIQALGHTVWFDEELTGGQLWWDRILANIRGCDVFVYVLTPHSVNSVACQREHGYAAALGKTVLPVLMSEGVSTILLLPALAQLQFVDYRSRDRAAAFSLARAFAALPPTGPLPDPLPIPPDVPISYLGGVAQRLADAPTLSYEEQSALLIDLKGSLRDPAIAGDARRVLHEFRKRHDLLSMIADEIDALLEPVASQQALRDETSPTAAAFGGQLTTPAPPVPARYVPLPTPYERLLVGLVGAVVGVSADAALIETIHRNYFWDILGKFLFINGLCGAAAGAIGGKRREVTMGALAGSVIGCVVLIIFSISTDADNVLFGWLFGAGPGAVLGAIAAVIYLKLRCRPAESNAQKAASA